MFLEISSTYAQAYLSPPPLGPPAAPELLGWLTRAAGWQSLYSLSAPTSPSLPARPPGRGGGAGVPPHCYGRHLGPSWAGGGTADLQTGPTSISFSSLPQHSGLMFNLHVSCQMCSLGWKISSCFLTRKDTVLCYRTSVPYLKVEAPARLGGKTAGHRPSYLHTCRLTFALHRLLSLLAGWVFELQYWCACVSTITTSCKTVNQLSNL